MDDSKSVNLVNSALFKDHCIDYVAPPVERVACVQAVVHNVKEEYPDLFLLIGKGHILF